MREVELILERELSCNGESNPAVRNLEHAEDCKTIFCKNIDLRLYYLVTKKLAVHHTSTPTIRSFRLIVGKGMRVPDGFEYSHGKQL